MNILLILPIVVPLVTAILSLLLRKNRAVQRRIGVAGIGLLLVSAIVLMRAVWEHGVLAMQMGSWPAPFGITLVADTFSAIMVVLVGMVGFATAVYSAGSIHRKHESFGYYALLSFLLMGVCGAFLTGDLFNLYVWFEVMLISSFVLLVLGGGRAQMEGAIKYVTLNLLSSSILLAAVGIVYGLTGTLNMADVSGKIGAIESPGLRQAVAMMFFIAFGIKAAVFPLFFWLPASYHTPPAAISAVFAGLLTKVGVYSLIRVFTLLFVDDVSLTHGLITVIAGLGMLAGVLGAAAQREFRRILAFHSVSQIGYMIMGLGLFTTNALAGSIMFIVHHSIVKSNLFLVSGVAKRVRGSYELDRLGGLYRDFPFLALLFMVSAMSLAGIPPFSGFFAKYALVKAGLEIDSYAIVATALFVGMLTLFSMTKIWGEAFWKPIPNQEDGSPAPPMHPMTRRGDRHTVPMLFPIAAFATLIVVLGLMAGPVMVVATRAAEELLDRTAYIQAVMGVES